MTDLNERFKSLDSLAFPGIGEPRHGVRGVRGGVPKSEPLAPRKRVAAGIIAFVVAVAGVGLVVVAFRGHRTPGSKISPNSTEVTLHANGDIWAETGGGEGGVAISRVDPVTGQTSILWTDTRWPSSTGTPSGDVNQEAIASHYAFSPDGSQVVFSNYGYHQAARCTGLNSS